MGTVMVVLGTRPEAVKLAPVVRELHRSSILRPVVTVSGQHAELLRTVLPVFGIVPDHDLDLWRPGHTPNSMLAGVLDRLPALLDRVAPMAVVVQGDTSTALGAALAAFNEGIPVVHVEAGLRTDDPLLPFPEEMNRRLISRMARLHLAPTARCAARLLDEDVPPSNVVVTGNTVIDALHDVRRRLPGLHLPDHGVVEGQRMVLVTMHRRESWGAPMRRVATALAILATALPEVRFVFPLHANPRVQAIFRTALTGLPNVALLPPLGYLEMVALMDRAYLVLTDSGGIQEEAPALGTPVLVLREQTERVEAIESGAARLVGSDVDRIVSAVRCLMDDANAYDNMARVRTPFGDGTAAQQTVEAVDRLLYPGTSRSEVDISRRELAG